MAVYDRWWKQEKQADGTTRRVHSADYGCERRWQVRYRDEQGKQRTQTYAKKAEAEQEDARIKTQLAKGDYVDPRAGQVKLRDYAEQWRTRQVHDLATAERTERELRMHVYSAPGTPGKTVTGAPALGDYPMRAIAKEPSIAQGWIAGIPLHANSALVVIGTVSAVFTAAADDGIISRNPLKSRSVKKPKPKKREVTAWTAGQVRAVAEASAMPDRWSALGYLGAACGQRQGELFATSLPDLDFLRKTVHVEAQVKYVGRALVFAPLKNEHVRDVPIADPVIPLLSEHVRLYPPVNVTLPWHEPGNRQRHGKPVTRKLVFTHADGRALTRSSFNPRWRKAWKEAGIPAALQVNGCHVLRHTAASAWLSGGLSLAKVAAYLGDSKAVVLRTYAHFMPDDDDRARRIMNAFFEPSEALEDESCATDVQPGVV